MSAKIGLSDVADSPVRRRNPQKYQNNDSVEKPPFFGRALSGANSRKILYDKDCFRIDLFVWRDILGGSFARCFSTRMGFPTESIMNEFIALHHGLRRASSKPNRQGSPGRKICRERMLPQSTDASALGLHSCRALSSESVHRQYTLKAGNVKTTKSVTHVPGRKCYPCIGTHTLAGRTQGSLADSATLGFTTESRWDSD